MSTYTDLAIADSKFTKEYVMTLSRSIKSNKSGCYGFISTKFLVDKQATSSNLIAALQEAIANARHEDTLLLAFVGHGLKGKDDEFYLGMSDFAFDNPSKNGLSWRKLSEVLTQSKARVLIILDACQSGAAGAERLTTNDDVVKVLISANNARMEVFAAAKGWQNAEENGLADGGVFSQTLC